MVDTTGSMAGLIQAAKDKVWSIATTMAQAQPAPEIRVGLVAFRDLGDGYVTRTFDLASDLDAMYAALMEFKAAGGDDGPEAVNQALAEAVNKLSWRQSANAYKTIFLLGDAPPHLDYQNDVQYPQTLALARLLRRRRNPAPKAGQTGDDGARCSSRANRQSGQPRNV